MTAMSSRAITSLSERRKQQRSAMRLSRHSRGLDVRSTTEQTTATLPPSRLLLRTDEVPHLNAIHYRKDKPK